MAPSGIEQATFRFVAQHLNHCATAIPQLHLVQELKYVDMYLDSPPPPKCHIVQRDNFIFTTLSVHRRIWILVRRRYLRLRPLYAFRSLFCHTSCLIVILPLSHPSRFHHSAVCQSLRCYRSHRWQRNLCSRGRYPSDGSWLIAASFTCKHHSIVIIIIVIIIYINTSFGQITGIQEKVDKTCK